MTWLRQVGMIALRQWQNLPAHDLFPSKQCFRSVVVNLQITSCLAQNIAELEGPTLCLKTSTSQWYTIPCFIEKVSPLKIKNMPLERQDLGHAQYVSCQ